MRKILYLLVVIVALTACGEGSTTPNRGPSVQVTPSSPPDLLLGVELPLNGADSSDPDGDPINFLWEVISAPANATPTLNNTTSPVAQITLHDVGDYVVKLTVDDGSLQSSRTIQLTGYYSVTPDYLAIGCSPQSVAAGDFNNDTRRDIALTYNGCPPNVTDNFLLVLTQNPDQSFAIHLNQAIPKSTSLVAADVNGDTKTDLILPGNDEVLVYYQATTGGFTTVTPLTSSLSSYSNSYIVNVLDANKSTRTDVVAIDWGTQNTGFEVFYQNLLSQLNTSSTYPATHSGFERLVTGDINGDGYDDVIISKAISGIGRYISVSKQNPAGGFLAESLIGPLDSTEGLAVGDVNNDGRNDLITTIYRNFPNSKLVVYYQKTDGTLDAAVIKDSKDLPDTVRIGDVNGDGLNDVVVWHEGFNQIGIYLQGTDGQLKSETLYPYAGYFSSTGSVDNLQLIDFNGDNIDDIVLVIPGGFLYFWYGNQYLGK